MDPVAFKLFGLEVRWYGILMATGVLLASYIVINYAEKKGYNRDLILDLLLTVVPSGLIGARLYYVIFEWENYGWDFYKIINIRGGGLAIHGGVIGGLISGYIFCRIRKVNFLELADMVAPGLILAQAIGRWGNYANSEAHGGPTDLPWGIIVDGVKVHPTFLYESIWDFSIFVLLILIYNKKKFNGQIILTYAILYSIGRFFIEGLRTDSLMLGPIRVAQLISILIIVFSIIVYYRKFNDIKES